MDTVISTSSTAISTVDALWALISSQPAAIRKAISERLKANEEEAKTLRQQQLVRKSLTRAMAELKEAKANGLDSLPDARNLF